jgi:allantoinase
LLNEAELSSLGARAKCAPPLRSVGESERLWRLLAEGAIDFVASDHSPAPPSMKSGENPFEIWGGISGVQSTLLSLFTGGRLEPARIASLTAGRVADRFGLDRKGKIAIGCDADFVIVDLRRSTLLKAEDLFDRHRQSPYVGRRFRGVICRTIARGATVFDGRQITCGKAARLIAPSREACHD